MKFVVIGGTGLIGSQVVQQLTDRGHEAVAASPSSGVNTVTGEGLADALAGADVVIDVSNSPSFEDTAVLNFFATATRNILDAEAAAGVGHHVALSILGTDRTTQSGYLRAKVAQENLITASSIPYSIVRATQFFEFSGAIADEATEDSAVHATPALFQPIAAADVVAAVVDAAVGSPTNGITEIAGPEPMGLDEWIRRYLAAQNDPREVVTDPNAPYFGAVLDERTLVPGPDGVIYSTRFEDWLR